MDFAVWLAAGLKRGADGKRFKLRLLFNPFQDPRAADFIRHSLARIGIDGQIESYDFAPYVKKGYTDRGFDITLEALSNVFDSTVGVQRVFWSKNFKIGLTFSNAAHYSNPEVDRLLFGANPNITIVSKKVKDYAPTGEGLRCNFSDLYI